MTQEEPSQSTLASIEHPAKESEMPHTEGYCTTAFKKCFTKDTQRCRFTMIEIFYLLKFATKTADRAINFS